MRMKVSRYTIWASDGSSLYVANTLRRTSIIVREPIGSVISDLLSNPSISEKSLASQNSLILKLAEAGFLVDEAIDELAEVKKLYKDETTSKKTFAMVVAPTMGCNMGCFYCYENKRGGHLSVDNQNNLLRRFEEHSKPEGSCSVQWHGGEPLLSKDIIIDLSTKFLQHCQNISASYNSSITTNGYLLSRQVAKRLADSGICSAQITLDGDEDDHNRTRKLKVSVNGSSESFSKILENIAECGDLIKITIRVNVWKRNLSKVYELLARLSEPNLRDAIHLLYFAPVFNFSPNKVGNPQYAPKADAHFGVKEFATIETRLLQYANSLGLPVTGDILRRSFATCVAVRTNSLVVDSTGGIKKCYHDLGNPNEDFSDLKNSFTSSSLLQKWITFEPWNDENCAKCECLPICLGGCPHKRLSGAPRDEVCPTIKHNLRENLPFMLGKS